MTLSGSAVLHKDENTFDPIHLLIALFVLYRSTRHTATKMITSPSRRFRESRQHFKLKDTINLHQAAPTHFFCDVILPEEEFRTIFSETISSAAIFTRSLLLGLFLSTPACEHASRYVCIRVCLGSCVETKIITQSYIPFCTLATRHVSLLYG